MICPTHLLLWKIYGNGHDSYDSQPPPLDQPKLWWKKSQMQMGKENQILMRYYAQTILANQILNLSEI